MPLGSDEQVHAMVMQHTFGAIDEDSSRRLAALAGGDGGVARRGLRPLRDPHGP